MKISRLFLTVLILAFCICGCGKAATEEAGPDPEAIRAFRDSLGEISSEAASVNDSLGALSVETEEDIPALLAVMEELKAPFGKLQALEYPEGYESLKETADQACDYLGKAVEAFGTAFSEESSEEAIFQARYDYAMENYNRAFKRFKAILDVADSMDA